MSYISSTIAGYFIERSNQESAPLSVLQLIKFVYISHGWNLALNDTPLIYDKIEAWKYGPVMPSLHNLFEINNFSKDDLVENFLKEEASCIKYADRSLLNKVYVKYKNVSSEDLKELMHQKDTPWYRIWDDEKGRNQIIDDDATKKYFSNNIDQHTFDSLPEYSTIQSVEEATLFLKKAGILLENGNLNPIYKNN